MSRCRILFIGIDYYAYTRSIIEAFDRAGYDTDWFPIEEGRFDLKVRKKLLPKGYLRRSSRYHQSIISQTAANKYDFVVFIQCHQMDLHNLTALREAHPEARFILYNWDSLSTHDYRSYIQSFDKTATFDPDDAKTLSVQYLPLFALRDYFQANHSRDKDFDLYFVGGVVTHQRFDALIRLYDYCRTNSIRTYFHAKYGPTAIPMIWRRRKSLPGLTAKSLSFAEIIDLIERSRGVFDFANHRQSGYTMRFIENMCAGKKIVTNNARVLNEDFYREDRFLVVCDFDFSGIKPFLDRPITSQLDVERFSIDSWAAELLAA